MTTKTLHRQTLAPPFCSFLGLAVASLAVCHQAQAVDFSLPKLEDLGEKWAAVGLGDSDAQALKAMGGANGRTETQTMGVAHLTLEWKDIKGFRYTARFLAGRLYLKQISDSR